MKVTLNQRGEMNTMMTYAGSYGENEKAIRTEKRKQ
jgi:hypothetical protein